MFSLRIRYSIPILMSLAIAAVACGGGAGDAGSSEEIVRVEVQSSAVILGSLSELIDKSDAVVIGSFSGEKTEKVFPERDPNNWEQINPNYSSFGSVYYLTVDRYLKGDGPYSLDFFPV